MRLSCLLLVTLPAILASAKPLETWQNGGDPGATGGNVTSQNDVDFFNYLLSVANLQNAFYKQSLDALDDNAFNSSGYGSDVRNNLAQIQQNKQAQVDLLAQTLGSQATPYCNYDFRVTNASDFTATSQIIENIGTSAYVGSIANISNATLQTWAASILASDAQTAGYTAALNGNQPVNGPFATPLSPQEVITLAAPYVVSCPPNTTSIYQPGRNLTITQNGNDAQFTFDNSSTNGQQLYAVFHQGLKTTFVPINNGVAPIPANSSGIVYAEVTNSSTVNDPSTIVAGPSFINIPVSNGSNGTVPATGPITSVASSASATTTESATSSASATTTESATSSSSEQSSVVVTSSQSTSSEESTVVVTATSSPESTVVVTATSSPESTVVVTATSSPESTVVVTATASA